ncbi:MAG TPA: prepilin-type N-terminal cleavage/methylation domain-containing protein [Candidatus Baltobacteraceae bacterium]|jgi:type II secretion system protein G|nr:prepilin-type N-terminal cleavage/methylation domain-containing protein [Candidatus Baltobacteraceae bacterium]
MDRESERGFTLIEMMIVVAIIAILVAILVPNFIRARAQAQTAACEANLKEIATILELYQTDHQTYPTGNNTPVTIADTDLAPYLKQTPVDPVNPSGTYEFTVSNGGTGNPSYTIVCPGQHDPGTMNAIGGTSGTTHVQYSSSTGFSAVASQ